MEFMWLSHKIVHVLVCNSLQLVTISNSQCYNTKFSIHFTLRYASTQQPIDGNVSFTHIVCQAWPCKCVRGRVPHMKFTWHPVYKPCETGLKSVLVENACTLSLLKLTFLTRNWFLGTNWLLKRKMDELRAWNIFFPCVNIN